MAALILTSLLALTPGTRLGVYQITAPLGEGGMGQVYRATDTTLGRQVAIKILPDAFAQDPERLARFEREAKTLASLNHPHIAAIYGFEKSGGMHALVMELVEGEELAQRIAGGAIPIDEALPIARQIAEALEAAHGLAIVHRDLKPANVKVRADGAVKVLDFGLAKASASGASSDSAATAAVAAHSPTFTSPAALTMGGAILGTAAYMAPEQARGKAVDKRADIWAFGLVLYEMLTGRAAFAGDTVTDIIAALVSRDPDWTALPAATPPSIRRLLMRCAEKDPKRRLRDIGDARLEIDHAIGPSSGERSTGESTAGPLRLAERAAPEPGLKLDIRCVMRDADSCGPRSTSRTTCCRRPGNWPSSAAKRPAKCCRPSPERVSPRRRIAAALVTAYPCSLGGRRTRRVPR